MGIKLESYVFPPTRVDYGSSDSLRAVKDKISSNKFLQQIGMVTTGIIYAKQVSGGASWGVTKLIKFPWVYVERPTFSFGLDGGIQADGFSGTNGSTLAEGISDLDIGTYVPAIFIPRIIQWWKTGVTQYNGCFILMTQIMENCTETDKVVKIHIRFEGEGYSANLGGSTTITEESE